VPSPLNEKLTSGQQTFIEVNGQLYMKIDSKKVDAAYLKNLHDQFEKNKLKEQVVGGFMVVDKSAKKQ
jgi:hypothetical protein